MSRLSVAALLVVASVASVACADNILKERPVGEGGARDRVGEAGVRGGGDGEGRVERVRGVSAAAPGGAAPAGDSSRGKDDGRPAEGARSCR